MELSRPMLHRCAACGRHVMALPVAAEPAGELEVPRWPMCEGSRALIVGEERLARRPDQRRLFDDRGAA